VGQSGITAIVNGQRVRKKPTKGERQRRRETVLSGTWMAKGRHRQALLMSLHYHLPQKKHHRPTRVLQRMLLLMILSLLLRRLLPRKLETSHQQIARRGPSPAALRVIALIGEGAASRMSDLGQSEGKATGRELVGGKVIETA
jgi:hypothetical protein